MIPSPLEGLTEPTCPKRPWVLLTLADDDVGAVDGSLPGGLRFHLSRCASCRAVADRLRQTSGRLAELASLEEGDDLAERAAAQTLASLRHGARFTGRTDIARADLADEAFEPEPWEVHPRSRAMPVRFAAAAAFALLVGYFSLAGLSRSGNPPISPLSRNGGPSIVVAPTTNPHAAARNLDARTEEPSPLSIDVIATHTNEERVEIPPVRRPVRLGIPWPHSSFGATSIKDDPFCGPFKGQTAILHQPASGPREFRLPDVDTPPPGVSTTRRSGKR